MRRHDIAWWHKTEVPRLGLVFSFALLATYPTGAGLTLSEPTFSPYLLIEFPVNEIIAVAARCEVPALIRIPVHVLLSDGAICPVRTPTGIFRVSELV